MHRLSSLVLLSGLQLLVAQSIWALTVKPNAAPVSTTPVADYQQYLETTRVIDLATAFKDPDATAAVEVTTVLGSMKFTLDGETTPLTVANFLNYVNSGRYYKTDPTNGQAALLFFHRSATSSGVPFLIQAGGYIGTVNPSFPTAVQATEVVAFAPVRDEPFISN